MSWLCFPFGARVSQPKALYKPSNFTIGRYRCVAIDADDKIISGRRGWIFEAGPKRLGVVTVARGGNEKITYCDLADLDSQVLRIDVLNVSPDQAAHYANNPNARHAPAKAGAA